MQFALIGDHPDGLALARELAEVPGYALTVYAGPAATGEWLRRNGFALDVLHDLEEVLARSDIELVIVADEFSHRPQVLRRALQSEKHVLCVHPFDLLPDVGYEVAMIQEETKRILLPILSERLHPALQRLRQVIEQGTLGTVSMIECERTFVAPTVRGDVAWQFHPLLSLWDSLRFLTSDIRELSALAESAEGLQPHDQVTLTGRCESGTLFRYSLMPRDKDSIRLFVRGDKGEAEFFAVQGFTGPTSLRSPSGKESWEPQNSSKLTALSVAAGFTPAAPDATAGVKPAATIARWQDAIRCLELFEAARKSAKRKRVITMQYEEFTEESNFKSVMTAAGCGLLVVLMILLFTAPLAPWVLYVSLPLLVLFLGLQLFRGIVPKERKVEARNTK